jgi:hypothetical protein
MKKIIVFAFVASLLIVSCKKEGKKIEGPQFSVESKTVTINWTGYKTTSKIPVKGEFKTLEVLNSKEAPTAVEALNGTKFSIPISSIFSGDDDRDGKLKQLFFGAMEATLSLTGTVNLNDDGTGSVNLSMNGVSKNIPITYTVKEQLVEFNGTLDIINDFNAQTALESISKACYDLHKGPDGVSKTWSEVAIAASVYLKKE